MALSDDEWAWHRMPTHKDIEECSSFRCEIDGTVHRFVCVKLLSMGARVMPKLHQRWSSLCGLHPEKCPPGVDKPVSCINCLAEGA